MGIIIAFKSSQLTINSDEVFLSGFLCSLLCPPEAHESKDRSANLPTALFHMVFFNVYPSRLYFGVSGKSPIHLLIGQGAVNVPAHYQSAILDDISPCFLPALGNQLKHSLENVQHLYSVNFLFYILKIQPLIICVSMVLLWTGCGSKPKMM